MIVANIECRNKVCLTIDELPSGDIELGLRDLQHEVTKEDGKVTHVRSKIKESIAVVPKERRALIANLLIGNENPT